MWWLALISLAAVPDELAVRVHTDLCDLEQLAPEALSRALEGVRIVDPAQASRGRTRFVLELSPLKDRALQVVLFDERGERSLVRALPVRPDACTAAADGIAVIVERHLRGLGWVPEDEAPPPVVKKPAITPRIEPEPVITTPAIVEPEPIVEAVESATTATATVADLIELPPVPKTSTPAIARDQPPPPEDRLPIAIALAVRADPRRAGPELSGRARFSNFSVGLALGYSFPETTYEVFRENRVAPVGEVTLSIGHLQLEGGYCFDFAPVTACGEVGVGLELFFAESAGPLIFNPTDELALRPTVLARARVELAVTERISLVGFLGLRARPIAGPGVEGATERIPEPAIPEAGLGLSIRVN